MTKIGITFVMSISNSKNFTTNRLYSNKYKEII